MHRNQEEKDLARAQGYADANRVEWERFTGNPELRSYIQNLQKRFGLPLPFRKLMDWIGVLDHISLEELLTNEKAIRRNEFDKDLKMLVDHFRIPFKFAYSLRTWVMRGHEETYPLGYGFPDVREGIDENGKAIFDVVITPETDIENSMTKDFIEQIRQINQEPPPQPLPLSKRQLDWTPVWLWRKRHLDVTVGEIAQMIGRNRVTVSRALGKLDLQNKG